MLVYTPPPPMYPSTMSRPSEPVFKRQKTRSDAPRAGKRSVSPTGSSYDGLGPHNLPPRGASPMGSFYSQSSSSSPSIASDSAASSRSKRKELPLPPPPLILGSSWLARAPRSMPSLSVLSPTQSEFAPDTPTEVPEAELRRRQLEKATRILGESVPLELVFQSRHPLVKSFPDPPPRRSTGSPQPGQQPREMLTERRAGKIVRKASLSLSTFASKLRGVASTSHSRDSSLESQSTASSDHGHQSNTAFVHTMARRRSVILPSPVIFSFPSLRSPSRAPSRAQTSPPSPAPADAGPVMDIRSPDSSAPEDHGHDEDATPVHEHPARLPPLYFHSQSEVVPRMVPLPSPTHTHTRADSEELYTRPGTPFHSSRPGTPFSHLARPTTPFTDLDPAESASAPTPASFATRVPRRERGQGWSGEWNQRDMQAVIQKLRTLK